MKLRDLLSVVSLIFSSNFNQIIDQNSFKNLNKNWLLQTDSTDCENGNKFYLSDLNYENAEQDFEKLKRYFDLSIFMKIDNFKILEFYSVVNYERVIKPCQISNMLIYISQALKEKNDRDLEKFLNSYFLDSANDLAFILIKESKSTYFKALGYFFKDFLNLLKMIER